MNVGINDDDINRTTGILDRLELAFLKCGGYIFSFVLVTLVYIGVIVSAVMTLALVLSPIWVPIWMLVGD